MSDAKSTCIQTHWAVLIGVGVNKAPPPDPGDDRLDPPTDRSLKGAVADIDAVADYLGSQPHVKITKLTATKNPDSVREAGSTSGPLEDPEYLPTRTNVCSVLQAVIDEGRSGQVKQVYIHFSGHGSRMHRVGVLALVLYGSYLPSTKLAKDIDQMVKQDMVVTLVLDCCFSGSVHRTDKAYEHNVRYIEYDPFLNEDCEPVDNLQEVASHSRDSTLARDHFLDPKGYTVITACSPSELASEIEFRGGARRGALSFFLDRSLRVLRTTQTQITHQTLYHHLLARFHAEWPQQTPMRYGSIDICFFRELLGGAGLPFISIVCRQQIGDVLILSAGEAHGVHEGDEYEAYPYWASEDAHGAINREPIIVQVRKVDSFTSELVVVDTTQAESIARTKTWKARPRSSLSPRKTRVQLMSSLPDLDKSQALHEAKAHPFLQLSADEISTEPCDLAVHLNTTADCYEIHDGVAKKIPILPTLQRSGGSAITALTNILGHLAAFKFFERWENRHPDPQFESSFVVQADNPLGQDGWFEVKHQETWHLSVRNLSDSPIYVAVFDFRMSWQVGNMIWEESEGDFLEIPPRAYSESTCELPLAMEVPDYVRRTDLRQCEDIIKIFITNKATAFPHMVLPRLTDRNMRGSVDQLSKFLECFTSGFSSARDGSSIGKWSTRNFLIRTHL